MNSQRPCKKTRIVEPVSLDIKIAGKLPAYDVKLDEQEDRWIINEEDKLRKEGQLFTKLDLNAVSKYIPKQIDLDKFLEGLKYKVIHNYKIPITIKELRAEYACSPWFQDIYKYLQKGICRFSGNAKFLFKQSCEDYFLINDVFIQNQIWTSTRRDYFCIVYTRKVYSYYFTSIS